jgi:hypothetical protein
MAEFGGNRGGLGADIGKGNYTLVPDEVRAFSCENAVGALGFIAKGAGLLIAGRVMPGSVPLISTPLKAGGVVLVATGILDLAGECYEEHAGRLAYRNGREKRMEACLGLTEDRSAQSAI